MLVISALAPLRANGAPAAVVAPVPPLVTLSVPPKVIVPADVIGPPVVVRPVVPPDTSTEVTVPEPPPPLELTGCGGGPTCKSSSEVWLPPAPAKLNRLTKNRYHSRDTNPVRLSMKSTRFEGMLVTFCCELGIGGRQMQLSTHDSDFYGVCARNLVHAVA